MYRYLLDIAIILISTKLLGILTKRIQLPQVVGALVAGLLLGPACFGLIAETEFISSIAEVGVIVLMFSAGLQTDIDELKRSGKAAFVIALMGVILPLAGGYLLTAAFNPGAGRDAILHNMFIGVVLTATSVSITVETLKELGKLSTRSGNAILGAALIDDILGIIALTVITSFSDATVNLWLMGLKIIGFFAFAGVVGWLFNRFVRPWMDSYDKDFRLFSILSLAFCLILSFLAEAVFGVSDITGAFLAGLILSSTKRTTYMMGKIDTLLYLLLSPVFFANVGLKVTLDGMTGAMVLFSVLLLAVAILTKIVGCGLGAKLCRYTNLQALKIGTGMISRGEVALIVAAKGEALGLMPGEFFAPIIIVVVATTIVTPVLLKLIYRYQARLETGHTTDTMVTSPLVDRHQDRIDLEMLTQSVTRLHEDVQDILQELDEVDDEVERARTDRTNGEAEK
jgi:Kef-type K+ transport system membrane component KefB